MINTKQKNLFLREIKKYIYRRNGYYIDLTYGKGNISKIISNNISSKGKLFAYEINKQFKLLKKLKKRRNVFFYKECFTSIKRLKLEREISCSIIDIGVTENELVNNYNKLSLYSFNNKGNIEEIINFSSSKKLEKLLLKVSNNKEKRRFIKETVASRNNKLITQGNYKGNIRYNLTEKIFTHLSKINMLSKVRVILDYISNITGKLSYIIIMCFSLKESNLVDRFYRENIEIFYYCKTIRKRMNLKSFADMKVIKKR
ncbi:hypothetical protein [Candidatus Vidania fulgoroideorum]